MTEKRKRIRKPRTLAKHVDSRPTIYHEYWCQQICDHVSQGWSVYRFCRDPRNPTYSTVLKWQREYEDFASKLAHAREEGAESHVDRMGYVREQVELGLMDPQAGRVAMQGYRDHAGMIKPRKYGAKLDLTGAGRDGAILVQFAEGDDKLM